MNTFHQALHKLIEKDESRANFDEQLKTNIYAACEILQINPETGNFYAEEKLRDNSIRGKYISLSFNILLSIKNDENLISINYINDVKKIFQFIISLGILPNLLPGVGISLKKRIKNADQIPVEPLTIEESYYRLSGTTKCLLLCMKLVPLRNFIISNHFNDLLASLFQLCYAPIKKPVESNTVKENEFVMTLNFYEEIMNDRHNFQQELDKLLLETYSPKVIKELMFFYGNSTSPKWLKSIVYKLLINKLLLTDGVESLIKTVLDFEGIDTGAKWNQCDTIVKLLMTKPTNLNEKYYENICAQVLKLLDKKNKHDEFNSNLIQIIVSACIKYLYEKDQINCEQYFFNKIFSKLSKYSTMRNIETENEIDITPNNMIKIIYLWFSCFVETSPTLQTLPYTSLNPTIAILFHMFVISHKNTNCKITNNLKAILTKYISDCTENEKKIIFEVFLYGKETNTIFQLNHNFEIVLNENNDAALKKYDGKIRISSLDRSESFLNLIRGTDTSNIIIPLCIYLLDTSIITSSCSKTTNLSLKDVDNILVLDETTEHKLVSYKLLSDLIEDPKVHKHLQKHPDKILNFIESTLKNFVINNLHKSLSFDDERFQNLFRLIMILNIICEKEVLSDSLKNTLMLIKNETKNVELKMLLSSICVSDSSTIPNVKVQSKYEKAIEDICDPFLPVRGHGLMSLAKLIEEKDSEACSNKQYILNISQQFLKNEDSYIYLNAIKVLAALGEIFPETVINILTEEYSMGSKELFEKDCETRMKLGEVLLRVIKSLGEVAPKYKSILLNTFLSGVKDEDHLMRASSLSNLGEVCRVLGFKLGSVVTEVLDCIHAVMATDKAVEARRAAVSVIRYLFVGLEKDTIVILKEEILPIYRTLKELYTSDPDDITRLQAQLALEELNANVRDYLFSAVKFEKKSVMSS